MEPVYLTFILMLSIFLGFELINKVPSTLHTPLMSDRTRSPASRWWARLSRRRGTARGTAHPLADRRVPGDDQRGRRLLVTDRMLACSRKRGSEAMDNRPHQPRYVVAAVLFIYGLKMLSSPATARAAT
jgi:NAD(P) transhydrogenase subunit alpha